MDGHDGEDEDEADERARVQRETAGVAAQKEGGEGGPKKVLKERKVRRLRGRYANPPTGARVQTAQRHQKIAKIGPKGTFYRRAPVQDHDRDRRVHPLRERACFDSAAEKKENRK